MNDIPAEVKSVLQTLEHSGFEAWCVGGCVRDILRGCTPKDWDVTTSALPEQIRALFAPHSFPTGLQHGTVTVCTGGRSIEVTTYRRDGAYADSRHPSEVTFTSSLTEDLRRRDFTVNAIAMDVRGNQFDPMHGREDISLRLLRCVGEPDKRFEEDALRIMRGLRFASVLDFSLEPDTAQSIRRNRNALRKIAVERIQCEWNQLLCGPAAVKVLRGFPEVFGVFWPELLPLVGLNQRNFHHCYDVWEHTLHSVAAIPPVLELRLTMLLHDVGKPRTFKVDKKGIGHFYGHAAMSETMANSMMRRLKYSNRRRETVCRLVAWHDWAFPPTEKGVRRALRKLGETNLRQLLAVKRADNLAKHPDFHSTQKLFDEAGRILDDLIQREECFSLRQLAVNGKDVMGVGFLGPDIGQELQILLNRVLEESLPNERDYLLQSARKDYRGENPHHTI